MIEAVFDCSFPSWHPGVIIGAECGNFVEEENPVVEREEPFWDQT